MNAGIHPGTFSPIVLAPGMVSLDWLTLNMREPEARASELPWRSVNPRKWIDGENFAGQLVGRREYITQATDLRTAQFAHIAYINDDMGEKMATVSFAPHNLKIAAPEWIQVQFSNVALYTGEWWVLAQMFLAIGCRHDSISRVDIAVDGLAGDGGDFPDVVQLANRGEARYYGKADWLQRSQRSRVIGAEFGSRASNKFVRAYRKKREMKAKGEKVHITKAWERAFGFDVWAHPKAEVNRFEVQLRGKEVRRYFPDESDPAWVLGLAHTGQQLDVFASMAPGIFDFRTVADRARDAQPVCVWDFSRIDAGGADVSFRAERNVSLSDHTIKVGLRSMFMVASTMCDPVGLEMCERYAEASGARFVEWFERKRMEWVRDFAKLAAAGDGNAQRIFKALGERSD